jgi:hypothetical protein
MRRLVLPCLTLLLFGCGDQLAQRRTYLNQFVGHPDSELVQQLGVPSRTYETGGVKYLAYDERRVDFVPGLPPFGPGPWWAYGAYGGAPPQIVTLVCETTFAVDSGVVKSYALRGNACG